MLAGRVSHCRRETEMTDRDAAKRTTNTGGGANIEGSVNVTDGDFAGRDQIIHGDRVLGDKHVYIHPTDTTKLGRVISIASLVVVPAVLVLFLLVQPWKQRAERKY